MLWLGLVVWLGLVLARASLLLLFFPGCPPLLIVHTFGGPDRLLLYSTPFSFVVSSLCLL
jgi:hypothetical protein